jgi:acyl carrier protein
MNNELRTAVERTLHGLFPSVNGAFQDQWGPEDIEGWDSLAHLNMVMALSQEFGVEFDFMEVMAIQTIGDIMELVQQKVRP